MWKQFDLENLKLNFSKVTPFDDSLSVVSQKTGFYHNNRLTALKKWTTENAAGYRCFKRQASSSHLVDGKQTDYIEFNKITAEGATVHLMDIADTYYKVEDATFSGQASAPDFILGVVINDTYIGPAENWAGCTFYAPSSGGLILNSDILVCDNPNYSGYQLIKLNHTKNADYTTNFSMAVCEHQKSDTCFYFLSSGVMGIKMYLMSWTALSDAVQTLNDRFIANFFIAGKTVSLRALVYDAVDIVTEVFSCSWSMAGNFGDFTQTTRANFPALNFYDVWHEYGNRATIIEWDYNINYLSVPVFPHINPFNVHFDGSETAGTSAIPIYPTYSFRVDLQSQQSGVFRVVTLNLKKSDESLDWGVCTDSAAGATHRYTMRRTFDNAPYMNFFRDLAQSYSTIVANPNQSVILPNGYVVNYENSLPASIGHDYKLIARLDTQGIRYLGADDTYVYLNVNGTIKKLSFGKMFPSAAYGAEVNLVESEFCNKIGGYKIFNTTTYWNTIYNDNPNKICCSGDDWNGRIVFETSDAGAGIVRATSRVGHFWNSTRSSADIPVKTVSDEQNDFEIYVGSNVSLSWQNAQYTTHADVSAYVYFPDSVLSDTKIQQYRASAGSIAACRDASVIYTHNDDYQLSLPVLFIDYLQSDVVNYVQVNTEVYELLRYSYSAATVALLYTEIAVAINLDEDTEEFVIQGAYYTISGPSSARRILNPYDTSGTYCADVTGLQYFGYDSQKAYFYDAATSTILIFTGSNKLIEYLRVDNRIPRKTTSGIFTLNLPSHNIFALAFSDGVMLMIGEQVVFIDVQNVTKLGGYPEYGIIKINDSYYYSSENANVAALQQASAEVTYNPTVSPSGGTTFYVDGVDTYAVTVDALTTYLKSAPNGLHNISRSSAPQTVISVANVFNPAGTVAIFRNRLQSCKIGLDWLTNFMYRRVRVVFYSDSPETDSVGLSISTIINNKRLNERIEKTVKGVEFLDNYFQLEIAPRNTKGTSIEVGIDTIYDIVAVYVDIADTTEENVVKQGV
jgi:hypothetical protein